MPNAYHMHTVTEAPAVTHCRASAVHADGDIDTHVEAGLLGF